MLADQATNCTKTHEPSGFVPFVESVVPAVAA